MTLQVYVMKTAVAGFYVEDARGLYNDPDKYVRSTLREQHVDG